MTRERIQEIIARIEMFGHGAGYTVDEVYELASMALAAMDSEPVAEVCEDYAIRYISIGPAPTEGLHPGDKLYRHAQPVVPEIDRQTIADKVYGKCSRIPGATFYNAAEFAIDEMESCRAATFQAGNSPVIPDGYVMVPKEITDEIGEAIAMQANCCGGIALDIYDAMLAAAPHDTPALNSLQIVDSVAGKWIPVSEQLPEECGRYWCYVEEQNSLGKSHYQWNCSWNGERWWVEGEDGGIVTHWMPLPAAPQEVKGE